MNSHPKGLTRTEFVQRAIALPALAALLATATAPAIAGGSKTQFKYQTKPNGSKKCSNCKFFKAGKSATADGTCSVVDGSISPTAYCIAWSAK